MVDSHVFEKVLHQIDALTHDEQLRLLIYVAEKARLTTPKQQARQWREIEGVLSFPAFGEDAQTWITRSRQESDVYRMEQRDQ
jgi:hypothetical protein